MRRTDGELWNEIKSGDVESLRLLHDRYFFPLCNFANKSLRLPSVAEELVSTCFLRLWEQRKTIAIHQSVKSYLYVMVRNQVTDYVRSNKGKTVTTSSEIPDIPAEAEINDQEFYADLYRAIGRLPEQRRRILEMAAFESMTYNEIAEQLNISVNTVKTQMGRAYRFLKEDLDPRHFSIFLSFQVGV